MFAVSPVGGGVPADLPAGVEFLVDAGGVPPPGTLVSIGFPGNRIVGTLHGQYRFEDGAFEKAGMLLLLCGPAVDCDALLVQLQPMLRFQSIGIVLPEHASNGGRGRPESWADDIEEILSFLHDHHPSIVVRGIIGHGVAGDACLLYATRQARLAAKEEADAWAAVEDPAVLAEQLAAAEVAEKGRVRCPSGCGCLVTWHSTHCCGLCKIHPGEHGPHCQRKLALRPPKRYDVRELVLIGCGHEKVDGSPYDARSALDAGWKVYSIHGAEDEEAELASAQAFSAHHHRHGNHRLRVVAGAGHCFQRHVSVLGSLINDHFEGARRLNVKDTCASLLGAQGDAKLLLRFSGASDGSSGHGDGNDGGNTLSVAAHHVNLSGTRPGSRMLGSAGLVWLSDELKIDTHVHSLDLSSNNIRASGCAALAAALEVNTTLASLDLRGNTLQGGALALGAALQRNRHLTRLNLRSNSLGPNGAAALAQALHSADGCALTSLGLRDNALMAWGAAALASALKANRGLRELDLSENLIKASGATAVGEALALNRGLTALRLRYNGVKDGALALAKGLVGNTALCVLDLRQNELGERHAKALSKALNTNTSLLSLELGLDAANLASLADVVVSIGSALARNRDRSAGAPSDAEEK